LQSILGGFAQAVEHLKEATQLDPKDSSAFFWLGKALMAIQSFGEAIAAFQEAVKLNPKEAEFMLALAEAFRASGDTKAAKERAALAHEIDASQSQPLLMQAELALQAGDAEEARTLAEEALKLAPKDANAMRIYADCLQALGLQDDALAVLQTAQQYARDALPLLVRSAQLLPQDESVRELAKLSQQHQDRAEVFFALSEALAAAGNLKDAIQAGQQAVKNAAQGMTADLQAKLHLHLGKLLKQSGQLDQSLHHLDEAIRMASYLSEAYIERGRVFQSRRQFKQALEAFEAASGIAPDKAEPHLEAANALKEAKDYGAAEAELRTAAKLAPKDRLIQRQLAALVALNLMHQPHGNLLQANPAS
jgi:tetratricopeptide (TPR) repeat protein